MEVQVLKEIHTKKATIPVGAFMDIPKHWFWILQRMVKPILKQPFNNRNEFLTQGKQIFRIEHDSKNLTLVPVNIMYVTADELLPEIIAHEEDMIYFIGEMKKHPGKMAKVVTVRN